MSKLNIFRKLRKSKYFADVSQIHQLNVKIIHNIKFTKAINAEFIKPRYLEKFREGN